MLDEPFTALDAEGAELLDRAARRARRRRARSLLSTHEPRPASTRSPPDGWCWRDLPLADVAALARKDLRLELRARDTLPAMLLFVLSTLVVFHFALPSGADEVAAQGLLWVALVFTALLGLARAWAPEREGGALDGLVLAPSDRSAIWLGKSAAVLRRSSSPIELVALPAFALFFAPLEPPPSSAVVLLANIGICAVGTLLAAMAAASRTRELILPLLFLPLAIPLVVGGVGASVSTDPAATSRFSVCTTRSSRYCAGRPLSTSSPNSRPSRLRPGARGSRRRPDRARDRARVLRRPRGRRPGDLAADLLLPRPDRADRVRVLRLGRLEGAAAALEAASERYDLESYVAIHQGTIFGALTLAPGRSGRKASWGKWWVWDSNQLVLFLVLFLFYSAYFMLRFSIEDGPRRANISAVYALFGVALIPVSFFAIRLAEDFIHPTTFTRDGPADDRDDVLHVLRQLARDHCARLRALPRRARSASGSTRTCASCVRRCR